MAQEPMRHVPLAASESECNRTGNPPADHPIDSEAPTGRVPVAPASETHLDGKAAAVLPLGKDVTLTEQASHVQEAPDHVVKPEIEKVKAQERDFYGLEEGGTVVPGIEDDKLWALVRRWNVQVVHTLSPPTKLPPGQPDLRPSSLPDVPFNSDLLKSNLERLYSTLGVATIYTGREMSRLMSWSPEERHRTAGFCIAYFTAAWFSMTIPALMALLIVLTVFPPSRRFLFPPARPRPGSAPSALDPTGKKGDESKLAGVGEPIQHRSKAEQIEQQAWEFTSTVQRFGVRVVMGGRTAKSQKNGEVGRKEAPPESSSSSSDDDDDNDDNDHYMDAQNEGTEDQVENLNGPKVIDSADGKKEAEKDKTLSPKEQKKRQAKEAKQRRDATVNRMARATQDGLGDFADALERVANALSPPRVYPRTFAREKMAATFFLPVFVLTAVLPAHWWANIMSFSFGVAFFGQPILIRAAKKFVELVPDWQDKIDLRNSVFSKVPTNAQLVLHILREAEAQYDPVPPPPHPPTSKELKQEMAKSGISPEESVGDADIGQSSKEAGEPGQKGEGDAEGGDDGASFKSKVMAKGGSKILGGLRLVAKKAATFRADVTIDGTRAKVGTKIDRIFYQGRAKDHGTLESFPAKLDGTSGHITVVHSSDVSQARLAFHPLSSPDKATFDEPIDDLVEIKKRGIFIARAVLAWASNVNLEGMGLEMRFKSHVERATDGLGKGEGHERHEETHEGKLWAFSHVGRRDQLFARLISIGSQKWETL